MEYRFNEFETSIDVESNHLICLCILNKRLLSFFISSFYQDCVDEKHIFILRDKEVSFNKTALFFENPFSLSISTKKLLTNLYTKIDNEFHKISEEHVSNINTEICCLLDTVEKEIDVPISYDTNITFQNILELSNLRLEISEKGILPIFLRTLKVYSDVLKIKVFFTYNLSSFFKEEDLIRIQKEAASSDYSIIDVEPNIINQKFYDYRLVVDEDYCEY